MSDHGGEHGAWTDLEAFGSQALLVCLDELQAQLRFGAVLSDALVPFRLHASFNQRLVATCKLLRGFVCANMRSSYVV